MNYAAWIQHFQTNRQNRLEPDWESPFLLPEKIRRPLARSLAEYQLGDGGGECRLIARDAESFRGSAEKAAQVVDLWFAEEKEHSRLLSGAVKRVGGTFIRTTFAFRLFNRIRRRLGVQFEMLVLLLVEIVSTGYYRVIDKHCGDAPLSAMCKLILRDEARHIDFHRDRLAARFPRGLNLPRRSFFCLLGYACVLFLWLGHRSCFVALGVSPAELFGHVTHGMTHFLNELAQITEQSSQPLKSSSAFPV